MISNYSHDHIALDTMNIMANGQYIDQIMTNNQFYIFILTPKVSRRAKNMAMVMMMMMMMMMIPSNGGRRPT